MVNAVAGGGTFLSFGALTLSGVPPVVANATSSITQFPGYVTSTLAYWGDIKTFWRGAIVLAAVSALGSLGGALLLLSLDNPQFRALVPWLAAGRNGAVRGGPMAEPQTQTGQDGRASAPLFGSALQFFTAVYGGFSAPGWA